METDCEKLDSFSKVVLSVSGGVADVIFKPLGIAVVIFDYDVQGVDKLSKDPDSENCIINNWPIIRQAKHDATCRCVRQWKCPSCGSVTEHSYEEIVEVGSPYCRHCEIEMTII